MPHNFDDDYDDDFNEMENRRKNARNHPLQLQINEVSEIVDVLLNNADKENDDYLESQKQLMEDSLMIIKAKLFSSLRSDNYFVCMQNAAIIRDHAEYLRLSSHMLNSTKALNKKYVAVYREEMEKFRELFKSWASEIKQLDKDDFEDEWGLF